MKPLTVEGLTASRDGHILLEQVKLEVRSGQVTGIIADNPERLSFLLNVLGGSEQESQGKVLFGGKPWTSRERLLGVGVANEQVSRVDTLSVLDKYIFRTTGREPDSDSFSGPNGANSPRRRFGNSATL